MSTLKYINRFRSGFTLISMLWRVKTGFDADPFNLNRKAVRGVVSIRLHAVDSHPYLSNPGRNLFIYSGVNTTFFKRMENLTNYYPVYLCKRNFYLKNLLKCIDVALAITTATYL